MGLCKNFLKSLQLAKYEANLVSLEWTTESKEKIVSMKWVKSGFAWRGKCQSGTLKVRYVSRFVASLHFWCPKLTHPTPKNNMLLKNVVFILLVFGSTSFQVVQSSKIHANNIMVQEKCPSLRPPRVDRNHSPAFTCPTTARAKI